MLTKRRIGILQGVTMGENESQEGKAGSHKGNSGEERSRAT